MAQLQTLELALIYRRPGARSVDSRQVDRLAESMTVIGLKEPIEVRNCQRVRNGVLADAFEIVTGQHRFEAARKLGWLEIEGFITDADPDHQRLWEIDENLLHNAGSPGQRAAWHGERESILVKLGLASAPGRGGDRKSIAKSAIGGRYTKQAAKALGASERTVQMHLARAKNIAPKVLAAVTGTDLDTGVNLDILAATPKAEQAAKLAQIKAEKAAPKATAPASPINLDERRIQAVLDLFDALPATLKPLCHDRIGERLAQRGAA